MSKMDNLRAMREARYEQAVARAATTTRTPATAVTSTTTRAKAPAKASEAGVEPAPEPAHPAEPEAALCGHRAISGRTCTREAGHAAKSHRYA